jgi:hypothetical protein
MSLQKGKESEMLLHCVFISLEQQNRALETYYFDGKCQRRVGVDAILCA